MIEFAGAVAGLVGVGYRAVTLSIRHWRGFLLSLVPFVGVWSGACTMMDHGASWSVVLSLALCGTFWVVVHAVPRARAEVEDEIIEVARATERAGSWLGKQLG